MPDETTKDQDFQRLIATVPTWSDLPEERKASLLSFMKLCFPGPPPDVYVVVDAADFMKPLAICSTREKAIEIAEHIIQDKWNGVRHDDDVDVASVNIYKAAMDSLIDREECPNVCWDALTANCDDR